MRYMSNIELFDEYTALTLANLYEAFPRKVSIDARELCGHREIDDFGRVLNHDQQPSAHFEVARATIEWLIETGYIRATDLGQFGAHGAVLTSAGLVLLKTAPEALKPAEAIGDRIVRLLRTGEKAHAVDAARAVLASGITNSGK